MKVCASGLIQIYLTLGSFIFYPFLFLADWLENADAIDDTQSYHLVQPYGNSKLEFYTFSTDSTYLW